MRYLPVDAFAVLLRSEIEKMFGNRFGFVEYAHRIAGLACGMTIGIMATTIPARAADITIIDAKISATRLLVTGKTSTANTQVKLDSAFIATSNGSKVFTFNLGYLPANCIVELAKVGSAAAPTRAIITNCAPKGVNPTGYWTSTKPYLANDIVAFGGSSWRAKAPNIGKSPSDNLLYWERFVANTATGTMGPVEAKGRAEVSVDKGDNVPSRSINLNCAKGQIAKWESGALVCASRTTLPCCSVD